MYTSFIFKDYTYDTATKTANFYYAIDDAWNFKESYIFDAETTSYNDTSLDRALQILFFLAGVSYFKTFVPKKIIVQRGDIDNELAAFLGTTYQKGLGEFFYTNGLDVKTNVDFPVTIKGNVQSVKPTLNTGMLLAVGGGKDSIVSYELASKAKVPIVTWSLGHTVQLGPLVERMQSKHIYVRRELDPKLFTITQHGAYNGHIPISSIFAAVSTVLCVLTGLQDSVMSNEQSANEATTLVDGVEINHQYSKSIAFEKDYNALLQHSFAGTLRYYSLLRPYSEAKITQIFSELYFEKYKDVFSSCNKAYTQNSRTMSWCGACPKCAFTFLALSAFLPKEKVTSLWNGKNLLLDTSLEPTYKQLLGLDAQDKPFECVGEIQESRCLMNVVAKTYPHLIDKYDFNVPADYDWQAFMNHALPKEVIQLLP